MPPLRASRVIAVLSICFAASSGNAALEAYDLRCEYRENPVGIDATQPRLSWKVKSDQPGGAQTAWQVQVASSLGALERGECDLWDSGKVSGSQTVNVPCGGAPLASRMECHWRARAWDGGDQASEWSEPAFWSMGLMSKTDWSAEWISFRDGMPLHASREELELPPPRYYRREFEARSGIRRAVVYATALGIYELHINGERVGDALFAPGWSDYRERVYYNTYDVTGLAKTGANAIGAIVADGWYSGYLGYGLLVGYGPNQSGRNIYGKTPAFRAQLEIEYEDGKRQTIATGPAWKVNTGPILEADMLMGEAYDARLEMPGWDRPGFADDGWEHAIRAEENGSVKAVFTDQAGSREMEFGFAGPETVQAYPSVPIRVTEEIRPVEITEPESGVYIFDMGQNFSGVVRLNATGPAGTEIRIRHGEMLHPDGRLMTENLRRARATDTYILRGDENGETWSPRFTYHGFQYAEVSGLPEKPDLDTLTGLAIHSDTPLTSSFECSDPMVNQLFENVVWTQRSNFLEVPTDCPQRDERFGWTGDAQVYVRTATYNADVAAFFTKWLDDLEEAQLPNGAYPDYAPYPMMHGKPNRGFATAWMDAGVICPWTIHKVYDDTRALERHYDSMKRFMAFRRSNSPDFLGVAIGNGWGDWLSLGDPTPVEYIDTVYFAYTARLMAEIAEALGETSDAEQYRGWRDAIGEAFAGKYIEADGSLTIENQTAYSLALFAGLIPEGGAEAAGDRLAALLRENGGRMTTGFLGTRPLLPALSETGHNDMALRLLQSREFPSWGYEIENGATTIWERWNSYTKDEGFASVSMNSFSHYAFGAVCQWMFQYLAGIDTEADGYKTIVIRPHPPSPGFEGDREPITWVKASYDSIRGPIRSEWRIEDGVFHLETEIPANAMAEVRLPARTMESARANGVPLAEAPGVANPRWEDGRAVMTAGPGVHRFSADW